MIENKLPFCLDGISFSVFLIMFIPTNDNIGYSTVN